MLIFEQEFPYNIFMELDLFNCKDNRMWKFWGKKNEKCVREHLQNRSKGSFTLWVKWPLQSRMWKKRRISVEIMGFFTWSSICRIYSVHFMVLSTIRSRQIETWIWVMRKSMVGVRFYRVGNRIYIFSDWQLFVKKSKQLFPTFFLKYVSSM